MEVSVIRSFKAELAYRELGFCNLKGGKTVISSKNRVCFGRSTGWRKSGIRFTLRATAAIQSEPLRSDSVSGRSRRSKSCDNVRLFVGLPLDAISDCNTVNHARAIAAGLKALKLLGVDGVELPVWWGTVEKEAMGKYEWSGYLALAEMVQNADLKLHVSLCIHASKQHKISLPEWVSRIGESEPSIFFTDRAGQQYKECLSLAVDDLPVLDGKTPVQVYREFCESFKSSFSSFMGSTITGVSMGLGPDGELQYPSQQRLVESNKITGDKGRYWINCFCSHGQTNFAELLNFYKFPFDEIPIVRGSGLSALQGTNEELGKKAILKLMDAVDQYIADPVRQLDKPFLMPIEDVFSIQGRGTVVTGRVEQGTIKVGEEVEVLGLMPGGPLKTTVTGVEMFRKILDHGQAGDNVGLLLRGLKRDDVQRGMVISKPSAVKTYKKFEAEIYVLTKDDKILRNCAN